MKIRFKKKNKKRNITIALIVAMVLALLYVIAIFPDGKRTDISTSSKNGNKLPNKHLTYSSSKNSDKLSGDEDSLKSPKNEEDILPLPSFKAPKYVMLVDPHIGSDGQKWQFSSESVVNCVWTKDEELTNFLVYKSNIPGYLSRYGLSHMWIDAQIDWAIDDLKDWKYSSSWDKLERRVPGSDWEIIQFGAIPALAESVELLRTGYSLDSPRWLRDKRGLHAVLKDGQFETFFQSPTNEQLRFDWTKHTLYARVRYMISYTYANGDSKRHYKATPWSSVASYGLLGEKKHQFNDLLAPQLKNLVAKVYPHKNKSYLTFRFVQDERTIKDLCLAMGRGFPVELELQVRQKSRFFEKISFLRPKWKTLETKRDDSLFKTIIRPGNQGMPLTSVFPDLEAGETLQVRSRYIYMDPATNIYSDWSDIENITVQ